MFSLVKSSVYPVGLTEFCTRETISSYCNMPVQSCTRLITDQVTHLCPWSFQCANSRYVLVLALFEVDVSLWKEDPIHD